MNDVQDWCRGGHVYTEIGSEEDHGRITAGSRQDHGRITAGSRQDQIAP
ncbi:MAG: hypothetical protein U9R57_15950 [Thermodesulfobacteriota bacterium]|nr:hypothetical protein [Thermodesulfobacteriota bacterium]